MRGSRVLSISCVGFLGLAASFCPVTPATGATIYKVVVNDLIHGVAARHLIRTIEEAGQADAELVLIELETSRGL